MLNIVALLATTYLVNQVIRDYVSRFTPPMDLAALRRDIGDRALVIFRGVGHSVHRDATQGFVDIVR